MKLLRFYQVWVAVVIKSLGFGRGECRYYPSCSAYALMLFKFDNIFLAFFKVAFRILSCNGLFKGGFEYPYIYKRHLDSKFNTLNIFKQKHFLSPPVAQNIEFMNLGNLDSMESKNKDASCSLLSMTANLRHTEPLQSKGEVSKELQNLDSKKNIESKRLDSKENTDSVNTKSRYFAALSMTSKASALHSHGMTNKGDSKENMESANGNKDASRYALSMTNLAFNAQTLGVTSKGDSKEITESAKFPPHPPRKGGGENLDALQTLSMTNKTDSIKTQNLDSIESKNTKNRYFAALSMTSKTDSVKTQNLDSKKLQNKKRVIYFLVKTQSYLLKSQKFYIISVYQN